MQGRKSFSFLSRVIAIQSILGLLVTSCPAPVCSVPSPNSNHPLFDVQALASTALSGWHLLSRAPHSVTFRSLTKTVAEVWDFIAYNSGELARFTARMAVSTGGLGGSRFGRRPRKPLPPVTDEELKAAGMTREMIAGLDREHPGILFLHGIGSLPERFLASGYAPMLKIFPNLRFIAVDVIDPTGEYERRDGTGTKMTGDELIRDRLAAINLPWYEGLNYIVGGPEFFEFVNDTFNGNGTLNLGGHELPVLASIAATPTSSHLSIAKLWASKGVPVWVEKPVVRPSELNELRAIDRAYPGKIFSVDFFQDSDSIVGLLQSERLLKWLERIGPVERIEGRLVENWPIEAGREALMDPDISGGGLGMDVVVHVLAVINMILEREGMSLEDARVIEARKARYVDPSGNPTPGAAAVETYLWTKLLASKNGREISILADGGKGTDDHYYGITITGPYGQLEVFTGTEKADPYVELLVFKPGEETGIEERRREAFRGGGVGYRGIWGSFLLTAFGVPERAPLALDARLRATTQSVRLIDEAYQVAGAPVSHELGKTPLALDPDDRVLGGHHANYRLVRPMFRATSGFRREEPIERVTESRIDAIGTPLRGHDDTKGPTNRFGVQVLAEGLSQLWQPTGRRLPAIQVLSAPQVLMKNSQDVPGTPYKLDLRDTPSTADGRTFGVLAFMRGTANSQSSYCLIALTRDETGRWIGADILLTARDGRLFGRNGEFLGWGEIRHSPVVLPNEWLVSVDTYAPPLRVFPRVRQAVLSIPYQADERTLKISEARVLFDTDMTLPGLDWNYPETDGTSVDPDGRFFYLAKGGQAFAIPRNPVTGLPSGEAVQPVFSSKDWFGNDVPLILFNWFGKPRVNVSSDGEWFVAMILYKGQPAIALIARHPSTGLARRDPSVSERLQDVRVTAMNRQPVVPGELTHGTWDFAQGSWSPAFIPGNLEEPDALMALTLNPVDIEGAAGINTENVVIWPIPAARVDTSRGSDPVIQPRVFRLGSPEPTLPSNWQDIVAELVTSAERLFKRLSTSTIGLVLALIGLGLAQTESLFVREFRSAPMTPRASRVSA